MAELDLERAARATRRRRRHRRRPAAPGARPASPLRGVAGDGRVVIKVAPPGVEPVAHRDVLRQARIIKALAANRGSGARGAVGGPGRSAGHARRCSSCRMSKATAWSRCSTVAAAIEDLTDRYRNACRAMAALHSLSPTDLGLGDEPVVDPVAEVHRWCDTLRPSIPRWCPAGRRVRDALLHCAPTAMAPRVVHGDFRLGNLLAVGPHVNAVIDWEIWSIGDPRIDAGWFLINCDPDTYQRVPDVGRRGSADRRTHRALPARAGLLRSTDLAWFTALACFKSAATWSLIVKHNRRRQFAASRIGGHGSHVAEVAGARRSIVIVELVADLPATHREILDTAFLATHARCRPSRSRGSVTAPEFAP